MSRAQKILTSALWGLLVLVMVSVIGAGWWKQREPEALFHVPAFVLVDQNDQPITDQTLRGRPWVAAFIFTNCAGPCPMMSSNMRKLQERMPNPNLRLVSFTVDPARDTPEVLKQYAATLGADESRWSFVTGSEEAMTELARGMLMPREPSPDSSDVMHSTKFLLVGAEGAVRGIYPSDAEGMERLATDASALIGEPASAAGSSTTSPIN